MQYNKLVGPEKLNGSNTNKLGACVEIGWASARQALPLRRHWAIHIFLQYVCLLNLKLNSAHTNNETEMPRYKFIAVIYNKKRSYKLCIYVKFKQYV